MSETVDSHQWYLHTGSFDCPPDCTFMIQNDEEKLQMLAL